jgi:heme exporter protein D
MKWGGLAAFIAMGGYGAYVWGAYGVTFVLIAVELILLIARHRAALRKAPERPPPAG